MHIAVSLPTWMAKRNPFLVTSKFDELAQLILELNNEDSVKLQVKPAK